jgi:hypothetical protein
MVTRKYTFEQIWTLNKEWEGMWSEWKVSKFSDIKTETMESTAQSVYKKLNRYSKELKENVFQQKCYEFA